MKALLLSLALLAGLLFLADGRGSTGPTAETPFVHGLLPRPVAQGTTTDGRPFDGAGSGIDQQGVARESEEGAGFEGAEPTDGAADAGTDVSATVGASGAVVGEPANAVGACTSPPADNGAYKFTGYRQPAGGLIYKTNQSTFPSYLSRTDVQAAIDASLVTWDSATGASLFANGGTTSGKPGFKDKINAVGFGKLSSAYVAVAYGWVNRTTKEITELDILLSNSYVWNTNVSASGDCGGGAGAFDVRNIVTHEAGHAAGLDDLNSGVEGAQTMYGYAAYQELFKRDLAGGDVAGVRSLYGP